MTDAHLRQEDLKALDQARTRLYQISSNIGSLKNDIAQSNPLPAWDSLQTSAAILAQNIQNMTDHLARNADLFQRVAVHPSTNFPGHTQEGLLMQLLRKKLELQTEEWVEEGRGTQTANEAGREKDDDELWKWAGDFIGERVARYALEEAGENYTAAEQEMGVENVRTGLRRKLDDEESEDEEDEDEEMEDAGIVNAADTVNTEHGEGIGEAKSVGPKRRLSDIMRYVTTGDPVRHYPSDRELLAKSNKSAAPSF